ncbi:hypothetical protein EV421DRAFT_1898508 [Armillaria borealis]|uniref:Uncharacterized protein n=1 Tax=Armillaria borealis TaxID=47425 RepID=A0AA39K1Q8_9AGAR|nr:hypothetical protein EV421DRAFT_1898508 [Armillaria borealis]
MQSPTLTDALNNFRVTMAQYANDIIGFPVNELKSFLATVQAANDAAAFHARIPDEVPSALKERVKVVPSREYDIPNTIDDSMASFSTMLRRFHYEVSPIKGNACLLKLQFRFWQTECGDADSGCVRLDVEYGETKKMACIGAWSDPGEYGFTMEDGGVHDLLENILRDIGVDRVSETFAVITFLELLLGEEVCKVIKEFEIELRKPEVGKTLRDVIAEKIQLL